MGVSHNFNFGPYVECTHGLEPLTKVEKYCSENEKHPKSEYAKFCSECGGAIKTRSVAKGLVSNIDYSCLEKECEDKIYRINICHDSIDCWASNKKILQRHESKIGFDDTNICEVTPDLINQELKVFENAHANELEILKRHYQKVKLTWGIWEYFS